MLARSVLPLGVGAWVYQMLVPPETVAPLPPSPRPSASPGCRPAGSSCQASAKALPVALPDTTSPMASRSPFVSCWTSQAASAGSVLVATHTQW